MTIRSETNIFKRRCCVSRREKYRDFAIFHTPVYDKVFGGSLVPETSAKLSARHENSRARSYSEACWLHVRLTFLKSTRRVRVGIVEISKNVKERFLISHAINRNRYNINTGGSDLFGRITIKSKV